MIHQYKSNGYNIVLDVNSGAVHVVDDVTYDVIELFEKLDAEAIISELSSKYKEEEIREVIDEVEQLKKDAKNDEALQGKITAYETQVANLQKELDETRLESAIKVALMNAKTDDVGYMAFKLKEGGALELDEDGNIKGIDEKISNLKTQFPTHFDSENNPGPREIDPKPLPEGDHNNDVQPKNLADALRMQYEDNEK